MTRPGTRSFLFLSVVVATWAPAAAQAQGEFLYKRDYTFERLEASRVVNDADDAGTIRLVTQVWHPVKNDQHKVVFFSHGSTGALALSPLEFGGDGSARQWLQFFIERGYTIVWPFRRGRGLSTGKYIEECATLVGECTPAQQLALTDRGLASGLEDNYAVIDQLVIGKMVPKDAKLLLAGQSRGGYLSLIMAGERPGQVQGAVNFAGAWQSMQERLSPADIQHRLDVQGGPLARAARKSTAPTLWIYAARDPNYTAQAPRELFRIWREAGGRGDFHFIEQHDLPNAHFAVGAAALWSAELEAFLKKLE